jgi:hypothetical protein
LRNILQEITAANAKKRVKIINVIFISLWSLNQVVILMLIWIEGAKPKPIRGDSLQAFSCAFITFLYAYQLVMLLRVINKFELKHAEMVTLEEEKKSITISFLTFSVGFSLKFSFSIF